MASEVELKALEAFAATMSDKDLDWQIKNATKLGVPSAPFKKEQNKRRDA